MKRSKATLQQQFSLPLLAWFDIHGRKDLPWQHPRHPYPVWVSEIMLQQTQVQTVISYFNRFITHFPTVKSLALAEEDEVLSFWSGLGYYSRARNLHKTAKIIHYHYHDAFPNDVDSLIKLPGIGPTTAAAISSQAFDKPTAILDGNVKRVLSRFFLVQGSPELAKVKQDLWILANTCMPPLRCADYTQAIMDLGALCCTAKTPNCLQCPVKTHCLAFKYQKQALYPNKKYKKTVPTYKQQFLILLNEENQFYLEKRPPTGLWGGLWCLPSIDDEGDAQTFIATQYALKAETLESLNSFKHYFSHFHLIIYPLKIKTTPLSHCVAQPQGQWFNKDELSFIGLAKPTTLILSSC